MPPSVHTDDFSYGLRRFVQESDTLRVTILPDVGAKIYDLVSKASGRNFLWHNPRIAPVAYPVDGNFDNYWCGGWDDGFPTCDACTVGGEQYPNLGELRSVRWTLTEAGQADGNPFIALMAFGPISPVRASKRITLNSRAAEIRIQYEYSNVGPLSFPFIWGTHPALDPREGMVLRIPARTGVVGQASDPALGVPGQRYAWPTLETPAGKLDMSRTLPLSAGLGCGHYAIDLESGWYAAEDANSGEGFLLKFSKDACPCLWMWLTYGGWRGYQHVILEPWTSVPINLAEAVKAGTARLLAPGQSFSTEVVATIYAPPETWQGALARLG